MILPHHTGDAGNGHKLLKRKVCTINGTYSITQHDIFAKSPISAIGNCNGLKTKEISVVSVEGFDKKIKLRTSVAEANASKKFPCTGAKRGADGGITEDPREEPFAT